MEMRYDHVAEGWRTSASNWLRLMSLVKEVWFAFQRIFPLED